GAQRAEGDRVVLRVRGGDVEDVDVRVGHGRPVADLMSWACPTCGDDTDFEQPPCADGHTEDGGDCPEWVCVDCGTALLTGASTRVERAAARRAA
ncbi:hypothetical protein, partial [Modestobacter sp. NPDC013298]|uniref:hypothetical protein n=1 Tax=Modestobacter sp. NPDC013298 TaxID=3155464 RepID=UPI0033C03672